MAESQLESESLKSLTEFEMDDEKWHFAYDIVSAVMGWTKGISIYVSETPLHEKFCFTVAHKDDVFDFLRQNERELKKLVAESTKEKDDWNYDDDNYLHCKRKILEEYKPKTYTEKDFVRLCAGIAFVAIGNQSIHQNLTVMEDAADELRKWIKEVLSPDGSLQDSTWAEN